MNFSGSKELASLPFGMAFPTGQRARRRRPHFVQSSLHSSCTSSSCSSLYWFRRLLHFSRYWAYCRYWQYVRIDATRYGSIVATTATQLLINRTWVFPPSGHWNPETMHRDAPGHWNLGALEPRVHRKGKGHRPENRQRASTQGTAFFRYPLGHRRRFLRCLVHGQAAHRVYDVLGGARWLQVQFLVSLFPRLLRNQGEERGNQAGCSRG